VEGGVVPQPETTLDEEKTEAFPETESDEGAETGREVGISPNETSAGGETRESEERLSKARAESPSGSGS
jgi:hypothetical protein